MSIGDTFQFVWFCLAFYLLILCLIDSVRPWVLLENYPTGTIIRLTVVSLVFVMCTASCPTSLSFLPFYRFKAKFKKKCKLCYGQRTTPVCMVLLWNLMVGRAAQYDKAFPMEWTNVPWGWCIILVAIVAVLNTAVWILLTVVWILTCGCMKPSGTSEKKTQ